jgi:hypothetical protein
MSEHESHSPSAEALSPAMQRVLRSAATLQQLVPDAVLVGGSAAVLYAAHRESFDHDHVLSDLDQRYDRVLDAIEASGGWATSPRASSPPLTIMGSLNGIEAGVRQLRRRIPLEVATVRLDDSHSVLVPTAPEMLRIKAYLIVQRNQVRDYLDVVALSHTMGIASAAHILQDIDTYYADSSIQEEESVRTQLVLLLAHPAPLDQAVIEELHRYKGLDPQWHDWKAVTAHCLELSLAISGVNS